MGIVPDDLPTSSRAQHKTGRKGPQAAGESTTTRAPINTRLCQPLSKRYAKRLALLVAHRAGVTAAFDLLKRIVGHRAPPKRSAKRQLDELEGVYRLAPAAAPDGDRTNRTSLSDPIR